MAAADYHGEIIHNLTMPDGVPRKLMDTSILRDMGCQPRLTLAASSADAYRHFLAAMI